MTSHLKLIIGLLFCLPFGIRAQAPTLILPIGHTARITIADYSPDGKWILTASVDGKCKVWDAQSGRLRHDLVGRSTVGIRAIFKFKSASFSPDSKNIITTTEYDRTARVWEVQSGKLVKTLGGKDGFLNTATYSPDNKSIVTADFEKIKIWDAQTFRLKRSIKSKMTDVKETQQSDDRSVLFSPDSKYLAEPCNSAAITLWEAQTGKLVQTHLVNSNFAGLCFSPDSRNIAVAFDAPSEKTKIWDVQGGGLLRELSGHEAALTSIKFSADGKTVVTTSQDQTAKVWDAQSGQLLHSFTGHTFWIYEANFSPDGQTIVTASGDGTAKVWDVATGKMLYDLKGHKGGINVARYSPDGNSIVTGAWDGAAKIWDARTGKLLNSLEGHAFEINSAMFSPDGDKIVAASRSGIGQVWDTQTGRLSQVLRGHTRGLIDAGFSPDGKIIATASGDSSVKLWDARVGSLLRSLEGHKDIVENAEFSLDGGSIITTSPDKTAKIWDTHSGKLIHSLEGHTGVVISAAFSPDGKYAVTAGDSAARIWDTGSGKLLRSLRGSEVFFGKVTNAIFSPDGRRVITTLDNSADRLWESQTGKLVNGLSGYTYQLTNSMFSPDGKRICIEGSIFDVKTGTSSLQVFGEPYNNIARYSPDGRRILRAYGKMVPVVLPEDATINAIIVDADNLKPLKTITVKGIFYDVDWVRKRMMTHENSELFIYDLESGKELASLVAIDQGSFLAKTPDNYYAASPSAARWLAWKKDNNAYEFDQWDIQYNRPDKVLQALGNTDVSLISAYRMAYEKRIRKMKVDTTMFRKDYHAPGIEILNAKTIEGTSKLPKINLSLRCFETDKSNSLTRLFVTVNGTPLYGTSGLSLTNKNPTEARIDVPVTLSSGQNVIKVSCLNNRSAESLRQSLYVTFENEKPSPGLWYIGIGISNYKDPNYNLKYATKDVKDLDAAIHKTYPETKSILLLDQNATREKIRGIKERLLKETNADDKIIVSFSGHGVVDKNYDFYFATQDIDFKSPSAKGLNYDDLEWLLDSIPARNKLVLIDACHSGELDKEEIYAIDSLNTHPANSNVRAVSRGAQVEIKNPSSLGMKNTFDLMQELFTNLRGGNGSTIISAAAGTEFAFEGNEWKNGVFTYCVLTGLTEKKADLNKDGDITVFELQEYVSEQVQQLTNGKQRPTSRQLNFDNDWRVW